MVVKGLPGGARVLEKTGKRRPGCSGFGSPATQKSHVLAEDLISGRFL